MNNTIRVPKEHSFQNLFIFLLLGVFVICGTVMVLLGTQAYRNTIERGEHRSAERILCTYVRTAVMNGNTAGDVYTEVLEGTPVLTIASDDYDGERYLTRLYCHDGVLRERYTSADRVFDPSAGEVICRADNFVPVIEGNLLKAELTLDGDTYTTCMALHRADTEEQP